MPCPNQIPVALIPLDELKIKLVPMTSKELFVEADAWFALLRANIHKLSRAKLEVKKENIILETATGTDGPAKTSEESATEKKVSDNKDKSLEKIAAIREHRTGQLTHKIGHTDDGKESEEVYTYRRYIKSVGGIEVDVSDTTSARKTIISWLTSKEGGKRWFPAYRAGFLVSRNTA